MRQGRDGSKRYHLWHLMLYVAVTAVVLTPICVLKEAQQCLYLSALALIGPWAALDRVRSAYKSGWVRDWVVTPLLYCAPLPLSAGLAFFAETLGLHTDYMGLSLMPALCLSAYAVGCVGPWLLLFASWPTVGRTAARRSAVAVATGAGLTTALCLTANAFPFVLFFLTVGFLPALVFHFHEAGSAKEPRSLPVDVGYVPRKDDDPFA